MRVSSERLDDAYKIIHNQQLFLESLGSKERRNLVITGLSENVDEVGATDNEKKRKVADQAKRKVKRLVQQNNRNIRPIHRAVHPQSQRGGVTKLKECKRTPIPSVCQEGRPPCCK